MSALGRHILVEFFECSAEILNDVPTIEKSMVEAARESGATVINATFHHFSPYGVSGVVVIEESHLAIHTWPEYGYAAVDLFTCGHTINPWISYDFLKNAFQADHGNAMEMQRGQLDLLKRVKPGFEAVPRGGKHSAQTPTYKRHVWFTDRDENIALSLRHTGEVHFSERSPYQKVEVLNTYAYGKMLTIDQMVMCTEKDEFVYHEMIAHVPMLTHPNIEKVLVIGGGDGGTVRELLRHDSIKSAEMVEIDETVVRASKGHLPTLASAFDDPKLELIIADGIQYVKQAPAGTYDLIIVDGSDPVGPAEGLFTKEFFGNCYHLLKPDGLLISQCESPRFNVAAFLGLFDCFKEIFGDEKVHCYLAYIPTYPTGMWSFSYCSKGDLHPLRNFDPERSAGFASEHQLKYYNEAVHPAAFALPTFVKNMLDGSK